MPLKNAWIVKHALELITLHLRVYRHDYNYDQYLYSPPMPVACGTMRQWDSGDSERSGRHSSGPITPQQTTTDLESGVWRDAERWRHTTIGAMVNVSWTWTGQALSHRE